MEECGLDPQCGGGGRRRRMKVGRREEGGGRREDGLARLQGCLPSGRRSCFLLLPF